MFWNRHRGYMKDSGEEFFCQMSMSKLSLAWSIQSDLKTRHPSSELVGWEQEKLKTINTIWTCDCQTRTKQGIYRYTCKESLLETTRNHRLSFSHQGDPGCGPSVSGKKLCENHYFVQNCATLKSRVGFQSLHLVPKQGSLWSFSSWNNLMNLWIYGVLNGLRK